MAVNGRGVEVRFCIATATVAVAVRLRGSGGVMIGEEE